MSDIVCKFTKEEIFLLLDCLQETIWLHNVLDPIYHNLDELKDINDIRLREIRDYLNRIILSKGLKRYDIKTVDLKLKGD